MDNCPDDTNPDQADLDNDASGNVCDLEDALLKLRRGRIRQSQSPSGQILVRGTALFGGSGNSLDPSAGFLVHVFDGSQLDVSFVFAPTECRSFVEGAVTCRNADHTQRIRFIPVGFPPVGYRFAITFTKLNIHGPFKPPLGTAFTTDPPALGTGIDRVGALTDCRVTTNGMICR